MVAAGVLLADPVAASRVTSNAVPVAGLAWLCDSYWMVAAIYALSALASLSVAALDERRWRYDFRRWLPVVIGALLQQMLLVLSAVGSAQAAATGVYLDGTVVGIAHTLGDQDVYLLLAVLHAPALMEALAKEEMRAVWERMTSGLLRRGLRVRL